MRLIMMPKEKTIDLNAISDGRPITERMWGLTVPCVRVDPVDGAWDSEVTLTLSALADTLSLPQTMPLSMRILRCGGRDCVVYGSSEDLRPTMVSADGDVLMTGPLAIIGLKGRLKQEDMDAVMGTLHAGWWYDGRMTRATARVRGEER